MAGAACILAASPAVADGVPGADRRIELRAGAAGVLDWNPFEPTNGFGSLTAAAQLYGPLSAELTVGRGVGNRHQTGLQLGAALRADLLRGASGRHGLALAAGGLRAQGGDYGGVAFAFGEVAYVLRLPAGFVLVAGGGASVGLEDSKIPDSDCVLFCPEDDRFEAGHVAPWARLEAGWRF